MRIGFVAVLMLAFTVPVVAQEYSLTLDQFVAYDSAKGPAAGVASSFDWKTTTALGINARLQLKGQFTEEKKLSVFVTVEDAHGEVLFKSAEDHWVYPGQREFDFAEAVDLSGRFDEQRLTVHLEASMKGFTPITKDLPVRFSGPPRPRARIESIVLRDETGRLRDVFARGSAFNVEANVAVGSNALGQPLRLVILSDFNCSDTVQTTEKLLSEPGVDKVLVLPDVSGKWGVSAAGQLPGRVATVGLLPFRITLQVVCGRTVIAEAHRFGTMRVTTKPPSGRSTAIDMSHSSMWNVSTELLP